jgi:hypothetical protein
MTYLSPQASTTQPGVLSLATNAEAVAGSVSTKAIVPSNLASVFAAPPAIGGTTPSTGVFTSLALGIASTPPASPLFSRALGASIAQARLETANGIAGDYCEYQFFQPCALGVAQRNFFGVRNTANESGNVVTFSRYTDIGAKASDILNINLGTDSVSIGSTTFTSLFNVGSSAQFQINSSGVAVSGTWQAGIVGLPYGGTAANLTASNGGIVYSGASALAILSGNATASKMLLSGASSAPTWSTSTIPTSAGTAGKILRSDGTNYALSTATFSDTYAASTILYANGANTVQGLTTANNGVLITSSGGVPSIASTLPNAVQDNITRLGTISSIGAPLGVTFGGSGTTTQFTAGSVVFAGASGVYSQDNSNLFFDDTNNRLGIGNGAPNGVLHATVPDAAFNNAASFILSTSANSYELRGGVSASGTYAWLGSAQRGVSAKPLYLFGSPGVGINVVPINALDVNGGMAVGTYAGTAGAPANSVMASGGFISASGNAATPAYAFFSDNTTGLYYTSNTLNFSTASSNRMFVDGSGNVVVGTAALSTSATNGFLYITTGNGAPSGVPTSYTGRVAMYYDTANNKFYIYNGAWRGVTLT